MGLGTCLLHEHDGILFPVAYGSMNVLPAEHNYSVTERECLMIIFMISNFQRYLYGEVYSGN